MHSENIDLLTESLMTPVEFYATEDTRLPYQIYYMFNVDGTNYAVVINQALQKGIYKVSIGAVPSKNLMLWKIKPGHIRTVLSTVIKIIEATIPIIGIKGQAYLIRLPNAVKKNYSNLLEKIVNRSFIKTMKAIHVNNPDKGNKYLFIVRKTANVAELFKTKDFKEYQFGGEDGTPAKTIKDLVQTNGTTVTSIEPEALDVVQDKKIIRKTLSKTPSNSLVVSVKPFLDTASGENIPNIDVEVQDVPDKNIIDTMLKGATVTKNLMFLHDLDPTKYQFDGKAAYHIFRTSLLPANTTPKEYRAMAHTLVLTWKDFFGKATSPNNLSDEVVRSYIDNYIRKEQFPDEEDVKRFGFADYEDYVNKFVQFAKFGYFRFYTYAALTTKDTYGKPIPENLFRYGLGLYAKYMTPEFVNFHDSPYILSDLFAYLAKYTPKSSFDSYIGFASYNATYQSYASDQFMKDNGLKPYVKGPVSDIRDKIISAFNYNGFKRAAEIWAAIAPVSISAFHPQNILDSDESATFVDTLDLDSPLYKDEQTFQAETNPVNLVSRAAVGVEGAVDKVIEKLTPIANLAKTHKYNKVVYNYTGQGYIDVNSFLRQGLQGMVSDSIKTHWKYKYANSKDMLIESASQMMRVLDDLPEMPESVWVFRGTNKPSAPPPWNLEEMLVDPGFLSTSITPEIAQSWGATTILKIFVPKGAKVIPAYMLSKFPSEKEVILPPMSVLHPLRVVTKKSSGEEHKQVIECIYIGHGSKWLMNKVTQNIEAAALTEAEEKDKKPVRDTMVPNKFATDAFDTSTLAMINGMLKKGKVKLEKVPLPRKKKT